MAKKGETKTNTNFATANDFTKMLNGNYRTVSRILSDMEEKGLVKTSTVKKNNREFKAYSYDNTTIKAIQAELKAIRKGKTGLVQSSKNNNNVAGANTNSASNLPVAEDDPNIVKIYEVTKRNNELENKINTLEIEKKNLEIKNTQIQGDLWKLEGEYKLIEMKQSNFESKNAELNQTIAAQKKTLNVQSKVIITLGTTLLIIATILTTLAFVGIVK